MSPPAPEQQVAFLTNLQRILTDGGFVSTYKLARPAHDARGEVARRHEPSVRGSRAAPGQIGKLAPGVGEI